MSNLIDMDGLSGLPRRWRGACAVLAAAMFAAVAARAEPDDMHTYDIESLAYMNSEVVAGDVLSSPAGGWAAPEVKQLAQVRVTRAYCGSLSVGETIWVGGLNMYAVRTTAPTLKDPMGGTNVVQPGTHVILFCRSARFLNWPDQYAYPYTNDLNVYLPTEDGLRIVRDGFVYGFQQFDAPGPYVEVHPGDLRGWPGVHKYRLADFEQQLAAAIRTAAHYKSVLASQTTTSDPKAMLRLYLSRLKEVQPIAADRDEIGSDLAKIIGGFHDPAVSEQALAATERYTNPDCVFRRK